MGDVKTIHDVIITPLKRFPDERGTVMHMMKATDDDFTGFGEVYCSMVYPDVVKGWHFMKKATRNYVVISGMITFVLFDNREDSPTKGVTQVIHMGDQNYVRVSVPPRIWSSFKGIGTGPAYVVDIVDHPHDPDQAGRRDINDDFFPYQWD